MADDPPQPQPTALEVSAVNQSSMTPSMSPSAADASAPDQTASQMDSCVGKAPEPYRAALPVELWLDIFRYASHHLRSRDPNPDPFAPERLPGYVPGTNNRITALRMKSNLVKVCREWRAVATELLYEHIVIANIHRAKFLARALQESAAYASLRQARRSSEDSSSSSSSSSSKTYTIAQGHGQWIRHLEIRSCTHHTIRLPFLRLVAIVLRYCTNLHTLDGAWNDPLPKEFLSLVHHVLGKNLRSLRWEQTDKAFMYAARTIDDGETGSRVNEFPEAVLSPIFFPAFEQLHILDLRTLPRNATMDRYISGIPVRDAPVHIDTNKLPPTPTAPEPIMCLPHVTRLCLPATPGMVGYASKISLPALRDLVIDATHTTPFSLTPPFPHEVNTLSMSLIQFFLAHGPSITSLELLPPISPLYKPSPYPLSPGFFLQPSVCPNLERLTFDCGERTMMLPSSLDSLKLTRKKGEKDDSQTIPFTAPASPPPDSTDLTYLLTSSTPTDIVRHPHPSLRFVAIRGLGISRLYPNRPTHSQSHFLALLCARVSGFLPALEMVRTPGFMVDASVDFLARDIFIWWTERFDRVGGGVDLVDGEGVLWVYDDEVKEVKEEKQAEAKEKEEEKKPKEGEGEAEGGNEGEGEREGDKDGEEANIPMEVVYCASHDTTFVHKIDPSELALKNRQ